MGILLVQLLRARGARVIGAARGKAKVDAVGEAGADVVIDYGQPGWTSLVLDATDGSGPAVVLDGVGGQLGRDAYGIIADGGRFSAHGAPSGALRRDRPGRRSAGGRSRSPVSGTFRSGRANAPTSPVSSSPRSSRGRSGRSSARPSRSPRRRVRTR